MQGELVYGWRTAVLSAAFFQLVVFAWALTRPIQNRAANRTLAALLIILAGIITPWMIGFAGFYDRWKWLSFAPFAIPLAIAPLAYLYVRALIHGRWPKNGWCHLVPAALQFLYLASAFLFLHQPFKNDWLVRSDAAYTAITGIGVVAGLAGYGIASRSNIRGYGAWLSRQRSDDHRFAAPWLVRTVGTLFVLLAVWAGYGMCNLVQPLGYQGLMGLYLAVAAFAVFLGVEGWRHATLPFPVFVVSQQLRAPDTEWAAKAGMWAERVRHERLYADPELSVPRLARTLGTNSTYVSRAFNEGLGQSFSAFINRLRCEEVAARLREGATDDLLELALDCGFSSKASFNRAFQAAFDCTPSSYRRGQVSIPKLSRTN